MTWNFFQPKRHLSYQPIFYTMSDPLAYVVGEPSGTSISKSTAIRYVMDYIEKHNLTFSSKSGMFLPDDRIYELLPPHSLSSKNQIGLHELGDIVEHNLR